MKKATLITLILRRRPSYTIVFSETYLHSKADRDQYQELVLKFLIRKLPKTPLNLKLEEVIKSIDFSNQSEFIEKFSIPNNCLEEDYYEVSISFRKVNLE